MKENEQNYIHPDQLCVGLYIHLDLSWMQHPFALSSFKIKDENQVHTLQEMALERIRYEPLRSDVAPLPLVGQSEESAKPERKEPSARGGGSNANVKKQRITESIRACESKFVRVTDTARKVVNDFSSSPQAAAEATVAFVDGVVNEIFSSGEVIIQAMDGGRLGDETYFHPLNMAVLSLMMAKSLGLSAEDANLLGVAALLHDIGMAGMPNTILMNSGPLSKAEKSILQGHCQAGAEMAKAAGLPERVASIILQHHECVDGSGYPQGLKGDEIDPLAKVLGLVNAYEALCNPPNYEEAMTPYGALSHLFANERKKYDGPILNLMIKSLGVYPPGSVVQLSDGVYGTVLQVNPQKLLRPFIMLHDKRTERDSPNILDLGDDADTTISKCLRADQLPPEAAEYLQCRKKLSYFFTVGGQLLNNDGGDS